MSKKYLGPEPGSRPNLARIHQCNSFYGPKKEKPVLLAVGAHDAFSQIFKVANENLAQGKIFDILVTFVGLKTSREIPMQKKA